VCEHGEEEPHVVTIPRLYRPGDPVREHVRGIYEEFGLAFDPAFEDDLDDVPGAYAGGAFWVVEDAEGIAATAGVVPYGPARLIKRIYVHARARRGGLARSLLRRCAAFGDFARTELWSDVRFRTAHQLYLSEGFVQGPTRVLADPDRSVERYFRR
jgi:GNAT superfamily N-acetyltransferase